MSQLCLELETKKIASMFDAVYDAGYYRGNSCNRLGEAAFVSIGSKGSFSVFGPALLKAKICYAIIANLLASAILK